MMASQVGSLASQVNYRGVCILQNTPTVWLRNRKLSKLAKVSYTQVSYNSSNYLYVCCSL